MIRLSGTQGLGGGRPGLAGVARRGHRVTPPRFDGGRRNRCGGTTTPQATFIK